MAKGDLMLTANEALPLFPILLRSIKKYALPANKNLADDLFKFELEKQAIEP